MEKFEEEIASALTNRSMGTDGLLKLLMELERRVETGGLSEDIVVVKKLLSALDDFMKRTRPMFRTAHHCSLNPALEKCLSCLVHIVMSNSEALEYVREETCVMDKITSLLYDDYELRAKRQILTTLEVLSRGLKIVWSAVYLTGLVKNLLNMLVVQRQPPDVFQLTLRILTNLMPNGSFCLDVFARNENYRNVMKVLLDTMSSKKLDPELLAQVTHLSYLIESSVDVKATTLAKHTKSALQDIAKKIGVKSGNEYLHYISSSIYYMGQCVNTIFTHIGKEHEDEFTKLDGAGDGPSQKDNRKSPRLQVNNFVKEIAVRLVPDFLKELPLLQTENPQLIVDSLLGLVTSTFPHFIPVGAYDTDVLESLIRCIDILASITKPKSNSHLVVIQTYNHFVERLLTASTRNIDYEVFHNAFKSCQIVPASTSKDLVRNVASIRLLKYFTNMVAFNDLIKKHLKEDVLLKLVECLLVEKPEPFMPPNRLVSMCLVEALHAISTTSKCPTVLMDNIQQEETLIHIANCIVNGDAAAVGHSLSLTGAVGFTHKCRNDLSKIVTAMRDELFDAKTLKKRIVKLENDLKKSEEARKAAEGQLEIKRPKI
ncbi:unnamed protein product [Orchesella dallaii]|uniref:Uncharacterized protein n=1 Tax=Orchesella dallaii TaxID=48710 RepID=A0ABP1PU28_9HEXA